MGLLTGRPQPWGGSASSSTSISSAGIIIMRTAILRKNILVVCYDQREFARIRL